MATIMPVTCANFSGPNQRVASLRLLIKQNAPEIPAINRAIRARIGVGDRANKKVLMTVVESANKIRSRVENLSNNIPAGINERMLAKK